MTIVRARVAGRYRLVEQLGCGGMGRVWLAWDEMLQRDVAIKMIYLPEGLTAAEHEELRQLTLREARAAAQLRHPNVVGVYDVMHYHELPWIVMEYVPSRSLNEVIREDGPLPPRRAAEVGLAVLAALRAAHAAGILHRDVKPGNVLLADDGRVVLTDFGLAVFTGAEGAVTGPGIVRGSPQYMSPERAGQGRTGPESDLWSLGATLYAAVEGRSPYARDTVMETLTALATRPPDPAPLAGPLAPVLSGLLHKQPARRMDAEATARALRRVAAGDPPPVGARARRRRLPLAGVLAAVMAVAVVAAAVLTLHQLRAAGPADQLAVILPPLRPAVVGVPDCPPSTGPVPASGAGGGGGAGPREHAYALREGWAWYDDPGGFSVAVPAGWSYGRDRSLVCFREPGRADGRVLAVDTLPAVADDLVDYWTRQEDDLVAAGRLPGYERIALTPRRYHRAAADWEYRYEVAGAGGHAIARGFQVAPGLAYAIHWITPEFDWQVNRNHFDLVVASFTPPPT